MTKAEYMQHALVLLKGAYPDGVFSIKNLENLCLAFAKDASSPIQDLFLNTPYTKSLDDNFVNWQSDVLEFYKVATSIKQDYSETSFDEIKTSILPQIKTQEQLEYIQDKFQDAKTPIISKPFISSLVKCYVFDQEAGFLYITADYLSKWGKSLDDIDELAMENLRNLPETKAGPKTAQVKGGGEAFYFDSNDGYDAARFLLPIFTDFIKEKLPNGYFVGIPHRDLLIAGSEDSLDTLQLIVQEAYQKSAHPLTPELFPFGIE